MRCRGWRSRAARSPPVGRGLERRNDGAYAVLHLRSSCTLPAAPRIAYALFADVDPTHRGIAKVQRPGQDVALSVLEPSAAMAAGGARRRAARGGAARRRAARGVGDAPTAARGRWEFLLEGVRHILTGYDHVLFLLCLLLPSVMRRHAGRLAAGRAARRRRCGRWSASSRRSPSRTRSRSAWRR